MTVDKDKGDTQDIANSTDQVGIMTGLLQRALERNYPRDEEETPPDLFIVNDYYNCHVQGDDECDKVIYEHLEYIQDKSLDA